MQHMVIAMKKRWGSEHARQKLFGSCGEWWGDRGGPLLAALAAITVTMNYSDEEDQAK